MALFYLYTDYGRARTVFDCIYIAERHCWGQGHKFVRWSGHDMSTYAVVIRHCEYGTHPIKLANVVEIDATCIKAILSREYYGIMLDPVSSSFVARKMRLT